MCYTHKDIKTGGERQKMWDDRKSLILSKCCVLMFMAALLAGAAFAPWAFTVLFSHVTEKGRALFLTTVYCGFVPAAALLVCLYILLRRIAAGCVFVRENTDSLRHISWCCFIGAVVSFASSFYWFPWFAVGVAAAFMGLIVRIVKNVVAKAVSLQDEADYTI